MISLGPQFDVFLPPCSVSKCVTEREAEHSGVQITLHTPSHH